MPDVRHAHSSSQYSKSPDSLGKQVNKGATHTDPGINLMSWTEVGDPKRAKKLKADGWGTYAPHDKTDCAIMWKLSKWDVVATGCHQLTDKTWKVSGKTHKLVACKVVLDARDGSGRIWLAVAHFPSGVEGKNGFKNEYPDRVAAWKDGLKGLSDWKDKQKDKYGKPVWMGCCADWNINMKKKWCRDTIQKRFPYLHCTWGKPYPSGGTHGSRLIDAVWCNGTTTKCKLTQDDNSSDHRPFWHVTALR